MATQHLSLIAWASACWMFGCMDDGIRKWLLDKNMARPARRRQNLRTKGGFRGAYGAGQVRNSVARPRNAKNPTTSVTVVRITPLATAGSTPNLRTRIGIVTPESAANTRLITMASASASATRQFWRHA